MAEPNPNRTHQGRGLTVTNFEKHFDQALMARLDHEPELIDAMVDTAIRLALLGHFRWWKLVADRIDALDDVDEMTTAATDGTEPGHPLHPCRVPVDTATPPTPPAPQISRRHRAAG